MACPDFERLLDYCEDRVSGLTARLVATHLASGCRSCADAVVWYRRLRALAAGDDGLEPPAWVLKRAVHLFEEWAKPREDDFREDDTGDRLIAALVFDSLARPALAGMRLAETGDQQLLYRAGAYSIDAQISFSGRPEAHLIGQVLREGEYGFESVAGLSVTLTGRQVVCATVTNPVGEFTLPGIVPGEYELAVATSEGVILIPRLPVTPPG